MKYNNRTDDIRLNHFARWVNGRFHKVCSFEEYKPWNKDKGKAEFIREHINFGGTLAVDKPTCERCEHFEKREDEHDV